MNSFKVLGLLLLISFIVNASCDYDEKFQINDVYLNTIYPELGTNVEINIEIESEEFTTNTLRIFIDEGYYKQLLIEEEIYLSKGINNFQYEIEISENFGHNIGLIELKIGTQNHELPIFIENVQSGLIRQSESEGELNLNLESEGPIKFRIDTGILKEINSRPINGTINLNVNKCEDCEMIISFIYKGDEYNIYNKIGEYTKPYLRIKKIENKEIEFVSCPEKEIEIINYESGYEKIKVEGYDFDLSKFYSTEQNEIEIINNKPLKILVKATDELNRKVESKGELILDCDHNSFVQDIEFIGEKEFEFELLRNTTCNISYNEFNVNTKVFMEEKEQKEDLKEEFIYWEDYILYGLVILSIIVMGLLFNKWRSINK